MTRLFYVIATTFILSTSPCLAQVTPPSPPASPEVSQPQPEDSHLLRPETSPVKMTPPAKSEIPPPPMIQGLPLDSGNRPPYDPVVEAPEKAP